MQKDYLKYGLIGIIILIVAIIIVIIIVSIVKKEKFEPNISTEKGKILASQFMNLNKVNSQLTDCQQKEFYESVGKNQKIRLIFTNRQTKKKEVEKLFNLAKNFKCVDPKIEHIEQIKPTESIEQIKMISTCQQVPNVVSPAGKGVELALPKKVSSESSKNPNSLIQQVISKQLPSVASQVKLLTQEQKEQNAEHFTREFNSYAVDDFNDYKLM